MPNQKLIMSLINNTPNQKSPYNIKDHMQGSYTRNLLYRIAAKIGRQPQEMDPFVAILEREWYDSKEALAKLQPNDYARLQIPERLAKLISE